LEVQRFSESLSCVDCLENKRSATKFLETKGHRDGLHFARGTSGNPYEGRLWEMLDFSALRRGPVI
jgi:hypothetical protein